LEEKQKEGLEEFDQHFETLLDYFAIIGFEEAQMRRVISEIQQTRATA